MREIEVKLEIKDLEDIKKKLLNLGCKLSGPISQHNLVYAKKGSTSEWEKSKEGDIILRIRKEDEKAIFTLKQQRSNEGDNIEYETGISEPEIMGKILLTLGYVPQVIVKKNRWRGKWGQYEVSLDDVEKLGMYIELEKLTRDDANPDEVREELFEKLESLGLSREDEEEMGYDTQIFQLKYKKR